MASKRNYQAEYKRRIANAAKRGLTRSQARGHARPGEPSLRPMQAKDAARLEAALRDMRQSGALTAAAKSHRIAPERLRRYVRELGLAKRDGQAWTFTDKRLREMTTISGGKVYKIKITGFERSSFNGDFLNAVRAFLRLNDIDLLAPFVGRSVIDAKGQAHPLETNPNTLHRLAASQSGSELFHQVYRFIS